MMSLWSKRRSRAIESAPSTEPLAIGDSTKDPHSQDRLYRRNWNAAEPTPAMTAFANANGRASHKYPWKDSRYSSGAPETVFLWKKPCAGTLMLGDANHPTGGDSDALVPYKQGKAQDSDRASAAPSSLAQDCLGDPGQWMIHIQNTKSDHTLPLSSGMVSMNDDGTMLRLVFPTDGDILIERATLNSNHPDQYLAAITIHDPSCVTPGRGTCPKRHPLTSQENPDFAKGSVLWGRGYLDWRPIEHGKSLLNGFSGFDPDERGFAPATSKATSEERFKTLPAQCFNIRPELGRERAERTGYLDS